MTFLTPIELYDLQRRIAEGEQSALKLLYDNYNARLFQLAYAIIRSRESAEEIVADVFIKIWEKREQVRTIENFSFYIYVAARNTSISYLRKQGYNKNFNLDEAALPYYQLDATPEEMMITNEILQKINRAINELPPKCRLIFKLVKEDGLKYREVAELLEVSTKTVENQIGIALKKIHEAIRIHLPGYFVPRSK